MAKKTAKSNRTRASSSASSPSTHTVIQRVSNERMVLRIKSSEGARRSSRRPSSVAREEDKSLSIAIKKGTLKKKKDGKTDAKMPKKPPTAFFYFLEDFRKEFQEQNPGVKSMRDIGKACGERWKTMTYEILSELKRLVQGNPEKVKYYDIATEKRAEFDRAMAEYIRRKESGEDDEAEDDSEFEE